MFYSFLIVNDYLFQIIPRYFLISSLPSPATNNTCTRMCFINITKYLQSIEKLQVRLYGKAKCLFTFM